VNEAILGALSVGAGGEAEEAPTLPSPEDAAALRDLADTFQAGLERLTNDQRRIRHTIEGTLNTCNKCTFRLTQEFDNLVAAIHAKRDALIRTVEDGAATRLKMLEIHQDLVDVTIGQTAANLAFAQSAAEECTPARRVLALETTRRALGLIEVKVPLVAQSVMFKFARPDLLRILEGASITTFEVDFSKTTITHGDGYVSGLSIQEDFNFLDVQCKDSEGNVLGWLEQKDVHLRIACADTQADVPFVKFLQRGGRQGRFLYLFSLPAHFRTPIQVSLFIRGIEWPDGPLVLPHRHFTSEELQRMLADSMWAHTQERTQDMYAILEEHAGLTDACPARYIEDTPFPFAEASVAYILSFFSRPPSSKCSPDTYVNCAVKVLVQCTAPQLDTVIAKSGQLQAMWRVLTRFNERLASPPNLCLFEEFCTLLVRLTYNIPSAAQQVAQELVADSPQYGLLCAWCSDAKAAEAALFTLWLCLTRPPETRDAVIATLDPAVLVDAENPKVLCVLCLVAAELERGQPFFSAEWTVAALVTCWRANNGCEDPRGQVLYGLGKIAELPAYRDAMHSPGARELLRFL